MSDKKIEIIGKKLALYTELLRNLVILLIAVGGGSAGLLFRLSNPISIPLLILGLILTLGLIFGIVRVAVSIKTVLKELQQWGEKP